MAEVTASMPPPNGQAIPTPAAAPGDPSKTLGSIKVVGAPFQITTHQERDRWLKALFYARHGIGKTELAGSSVDVPEMRDVLYLDLERGGETFDDNPRIKNVDKLYRVAVNTFTAVAHIQEFLKAYCAARDAGNVVQMRKLYALVSGTEVENPPQFRTVIVDSLSELDAYCTYQVLKINIEGNEIGDDIDTAGWPEFRKNFEMMKLMVRAYRDLPMNVLFIAAESYTQDEQKKYHYSPALTGKLSTQVQGFVDIVGYLVAGQASEAEPEAPRRLYVQPIAGGPKFDAKNRKSVYRQPFFDNPNMALIMKGVGLAK